MTREFTGAKKVDSYKVVCLLKTNNLLLILVWHGGCNKGQRWGAQRGGTGRAIGGTLVQSSSNSAQASSTPRRACTTEDGNGPQASSARHRPAQTNPLGGLSHRENGMGPVFLVYGNATPAATS